LCGGDDEDSEDSDPDEPSEAAAAAYDLAGEGFGDVLV